MKLSRRLIVIPSIFVLCASAFAETFEEAVCRQPPETDKSFFGVTMNILDKTNTLLNHTAAALEGLNEGNYDKLKDGVLGTVDIFKKHTEATKVSLMDDINKAKIAYESLSADAVLQNRLDAIHALGKAYHAAAMHDDAMVIYVQGMDILGYETAITEHPAELFDIMYAISDCAYECYDTSTMYHCSNVLRALSELQPDNVLMKMRAYLALARYYKRLGDPENSMAAISVAMKACPEENQPYAKEASDIMWECAFDVMNELPSLGIKGEVVAMIENYYGKTYMADEGVSPDTRARLYLVRSKDYAALGNIREAFSDVYRAAQIVQKAYPDGSLLEFDILIHIGDLVRQNATLSKADRVENDYTRKGVLYYLSGCRMLAMRIWGDENENVNPMLRKINRKLALSAVLNAKLMNDEALKHSVPSSVTLAAYAVGKAKLTSEEQLYVDYHTRSRDSHRLASKLYESELKRLRNVVHRNFITMTEEDRANYMNAMSELVNDIYNYAETSPDNNAAKLVYDACLLSKSAQLSFSRALGALVRSLGDPDLQKDYDELLAKRSELVSLEQGGKFEETYQLREDTRYLEQELQIKLVKLGDPGAFMETTWEDVKKQLPKNSAAVEFYTFSDNLYGNKNIKERYVALTDSKKPTIFQLTYAPGVIHLEKKYHRDGLYSQVWQPLVKKKFIKPGYNIYFSPAGRWNGVPLEFLPVESSPTNNMCNAYNMVRVSTTRSLPDVTSVTLPSKVALFGGLDYNMSLDEMSEISEEIARTGLRGPLSNGLWSRLPATADEVESIAALLPNAECTVVSGPDGIEEAFKALSGQGHGVIHVATHGYYCPSPSEYTGFSEYTKISASLDCSGLVFSGANRYMVEGNPLENLDNGLLTAREIALLDLSAADLVVMSACDTGTGRFTSEGVMGLQRGFKLAGANTLIMSLWKVNDSAAAAMMTAFYRHLSQGKTKRQAFYAARDEIRAASFPGPDGGSVQGSDTSIGDAFIIMD